MVKTGTIRIMIVDDHDIVRNGLKFMLETQDQLEFVGGAATGESALNICSEVAPDVILMDLFLPGINGMETTQKIIASHPNIKIIALTSYNDKHLVTQALQAGAISFIKKDVSTQELIEAIRNAYRGLPTLSSDAAQILIASTKNSIRLGEDLSDRELTVLELLVLGYSNQRIADELTISHSTVKHHVSSILSKLHVKNRAGAVAIALEKKLLS
ncbi:MAG: response regulator transcription factor [Aggregatilineales bacterium]